MFPWTHPVLIPNDISSVQPFSCTAHGRQSLYFTIGRPFPPQNCHFAWGSGLHLIHGSLCPPESTSQTTFRSVQPFFAGLATMTDRQTDRQTDRPLYSTWSVTTGSIYVGSTAMRPTTNCHISPIRHRHLNSTENFCGRRCLTPLSPHRYNLTIVCEHYHFMTSSDRFPVPDYPLDRL